MAGNKYYAYDVNSSVSIYRAALFLMFALIQIYFCIIAHHRFHLRINGAKRRRFTNVMAPLITAMFLEAIGYVCRKLSHNDMNQMFIYIIQSLFILIAPSFIQATIYMLFGEVLKSLNAEHHCLIKLSKFTKIFVIGDCVSIFVQMSGSGLSIHDASLGNKLAIIGLLVQLAFFATFMICMIYFMIMIHKKPTITSQSLKISNPKFGNWKHCLFVLNSSSILILIRSIYRIVEFIEGRDGALMKRETFFFVLDGMMMVLAMFGFSTLNFPLYLSRVEFSNGNSIWKNDGENINLRSL